MPDMPFCNAFPTAFEVFSIAAPTELFCPALLAGTVCRFSCVVY